MDSLDSKLASIKIKITLARQKLNRAWVVSQKTDTVVLQAGTELDELCNEYYRLMKAVVEREKTEVDSDDYAYEGRGELRCWSKRRSRSIDGNEKDRWY